MKKKSEITEKTRQAFVDAFCELYCQKPIEKISVQEIANKSGYNRSTFYLHFCNIYEVLDYVENYVLGGIREKLQNRKFNEENYFIFVDIIEFFDQQETYIKVLLGDYGSIHFFERLRTEIDIEKQEWNFPKDSPITPYIIELHISTFFLLVRLWYRREKDLPLEKLFYLLEKLYMTEMTSILKDL